MCSVSGEALVEVSSIAMVGTCGVVVGEDAKGRDSGLKLFLYNSSLLFDKPSSLTSTGCASSDLITLYSPHLLKAPLSLDKASNTRTLGGAGLGGTHLYPST